MPSSTMGRTTASQVKAWTNTSDPLGRFKDLSKKYNADLPDKNKDIRYLLFVISNLDSSFLLTCSISLPLIHFQGWKSSLRERIASSQDSFGAKSVLIIVVIY